MNWRVEYSKQAKKFIQNLDHGDQIRIKKSIEAKLLVDPDLFLEPLVGELLGMYKFRVGDYRLLCEKRRKILTVIVVKVGHRREVYN